MFVTKQKYDKLVDDYIKALGESAAYSNALSELRDKWNTLVRQINAKGGERFLNSQTTGQQSDQLSQEDIRRLLQLCHPDKHGGKDMAQEMTAKLLSLRR